MTRDKRIERAHAKVVEHVEGLNARLTDARCSPMSARILFGITRDLVGEAALLMTLLNLDDDDAE